MTGWAKLAEDVNTAPMQAAGLAAAQITRSSQGAAVT
jgi:hypothetical protein